MKILKKSVSGIKNLSLALVFCNIKFTMLSPDKVRSKIDPKYLTLSFGSILLPLHSSFQFDHGLSLDLEPNKKDSVLPKCIDNLLSISHFVTNWRSV